MSQKKTGMQKGIEKRGWTVRFLSTPKKQIIGNCVYPIWVTATKPGLKLEASCISDLRFFVRFEKFYRQEGKFAQA